MKPGIKTSELVVSVIGVLAGCACALFSDSQFVQIAGPILAAICGSSYPMGRSLVKGKEALGAAQVQAARELAKKE